MAYMRLTGESFCPTLGHYMTVNSYQYILYGYGAVMTIILRTADETANVSSMDATV